MSKTPYSCNASFCLDKETINRSHFSRQTSFPTLHITGQSSQGLSGVCFSGGAAGFEVEPCFSHCACQSYVVSVGPDLSAQISPLCFGPVKQESKNCNNNKSNCPIVQLCTAHRFIGTSGNKDGPFISITSCSIFLFSSLQDMIGILMKCQINKIRVRVN